MAKDKEHMTTKPNPIPDTYRRVTPCLVVQGGAKALEFYAEVFQATERIRFPGPGGTVAHAEIQIGDSVVIIEDESPERGTKAPPPGGVSGSPFFLFIYVEDVDAVVGRAVELGAKLQRPPQDQFYGDRDGYIVDPFGHGWTIATHVEDVAPEEMMRRMAELQKQGLVQPRLIAKGDQPVARMEIAMSDITKARKELVARILEGDGRVPRTKRRAAFDNTGLDEPLRTLIDKVAKHAYMVTDEDIAAVKASGLSEDQIFEIVVCAAIGQATRQHDMALVALESANDKARREDAP